MSDRHESTDAELIALEDALKSLAPVRSRIDRDAALFRAGQGSRRGRLPWMAAAASLAAVALGEGALLANRPALQVVERIVVVQAPAVIPKTPHDEIPAPMPTASRPMIESGWMAHDRLTWQVLRYGLDGLPAPVKSAWTDHEPRTESARQMLQEELRNILEPGDPS